MGIILDDFMDFLLLRHDQDMKIKLYIKEFDLIDLIKDVMRTMRNKINGSGIVLGYKVVDEMNREVKDEEQIWIKNCP